jgi:hypothetical protein
VNYARVYWLLYLGVGLLFGVHSASTSPSVLAVSHRPAMAAESLEAGGRG